MNMRSKLTNAFMGLVLLTTANAHAGGRNEQNVTIDQSRTTNIDKQIIDKGPKYDNRSFDNSTTATGGNSSGQTSNQTVNGGHTNIDARGGAMPFNSIGSLYVPHQCMKGLGINLTGGAVFVGGGGIGLQKIDPAGVPLRNGLTLIDYLKLTPEKRAEATDGFSDQQLSSLNCIAYVAEKEHEQRLQDERMQKDRLTSEEKRARWNISYQIIEKGMARYCGYAGKNQPFGATKDEHDKYCHRPIDAAIDELFPPKKEEKPSAPTMPPAGPSAGFP